MNLSPTSRTLFLVQIGTFFSGVIVVACNCLYVSAYPKSPNAGSLSGVAIGTLSFALVSTLTTLVLVLRQKSGRTISALLEGGWVGLAILLWVLAAVGGIAKPANGMTHVSCKVLPDGTDTDDKNFIRACQSAFASTAFCIVSALFFMATAGILVTFSIQRASRDRKAAKVKVGGTYALGPSPSQYRRAEQRHDNPTEAANKDEESAGANQAEMDNLLQAEGNAGTPVSGSGGGGGGTGGEEEDNFSENVYRTPVLTHATMATPPTTATANLASPPMNVNVQAPYNTYSSGNGGGHVVQPSYHSQYSTDYGFPSGHMQQGSSNMAVGYDQYNAVAPYPPVQQMQQSYPPMQQVQQPLPPLQMQMQMHQQQQMPSVPGHQQYPMHNGQPTPVMSMPRPEHF
ncbi:hypothetical protein BG004_001055 [Podila humilis]|nr:hypothetical protein BG004_001055 [Podila humilis]